MARRCANIGERVMNIYDFQGRMDTWRGGKINDILLSIQQGPNEVRPYVELLDFFFLLVQVQTKLYCSPSENR